MPCDRPRFLTSPSCCWTPSSCCSPSVQCWCDPTAALSSQRPTPAKLSVQSQTFISQALLLAGRVATCFSDTFCPIPTRAEIFYWHRFANKSQNVTSIMFHLCQIFILPTLYLLRYRVSSQFSNLNITSLSFSCIYISSQ